MASRVPSMVRVNPYKLQDLNTESFISVEKNECTQLPQSYNGASPKIMRKMTIVSQVQVCGSDGNRYHVGRFVIKLEVLAGTMPPGSTTITTPSSGFPAFTEQDVVDTLGDIILRVALDPANGQPGLALDLAQPCPGV